jgi:hypothetical protein
MSTVIGIISLVAGLAGSAMSANAQQQAGEAEKKAYEFNAQLKDEEAKQIKAKAMWDETISRESSRERISKMIASYAKSGVVLDEGSTLLVMADSAEKAEKDALAIRWDGDVNYAQALNEANMMRFYGKNAAKAGQMQAGTTLLQGIGNAGMSYMSMKGGQGAGYASGKAAGAASTGGTYTTAPYWNTAKTKYSFLK